MFNKVKQFIMVEKAIDVKIYELKEKLLTIEPGTTDYDDTVSCIEDLIDLKKKSLNIKNDKPKRERFVKDWGSVLSAGIGLVSVLAIVNFEKTDIIESKAMSIATKFIK